MNIRRHLLSSVFRSPDDPVIDPPAGDDSPAPPVAGDDPPAPPIAGDPPVPPVDPVAPKEPKAPAFLFTRLAEERARADAAEREAADLRERLEAGPGATPPVAPATPAPPRTATRTPEFEAAVRQETDARQMLADTTAVLQAGMAQFPDFEQSRSTLHALGATSDEFVADVMAADKANAHVLFDNLAKNPEKAVALLRMPPRQRLGELVRMSTAIATKPVAPAAPAPPAPPVSKAPKPAPALAPVADGGGDDPLESDAGSDEEFSAAWDRKYLKRA